MKAQKTKSVCPKCRKVIDAVLIRKGNRVMMKKHCGKHGTFEEIVYDAKQFERVMKSMKYLSKPKNVPACPYDCEHCTAHQSQTILAIMDLTNRCNLNCRYCFANAAKSRYVYEPSLHQIDAMFSSIKKREPACNAVLFSGGEPTLRNDLPDIIRMATGMGFEVPLIATNGIRLATDLEYARKLNAAGLYLIYLSFDGFSDATNHEKRNHRIVERLLENCRRAGLQIMLVPTISRENSREAFRFIQFAARNADVVRGVNFQPVSFCGRMDAEERKMSRYTISDLCLDIEKQSDGVLKESEFYPVPSIVPFQKMLSRPGKVEMPLFTVHPLCGRATYIFKDKDRLVPITKVMDVPRLISLFDMAARYGKNGKGGNLAMVAMLREMKKSVHFDEMPEKSNMFKLLLQLILKRDLGTVLEIQSNSTFVGVMHFQDGYNMDLERLKRCGIHYVTPSNSLVPFCAYNNLGYRDRIEKKFSVPLDTANGLPGRENAEGRI